MLQKLDVQGIHLTVDEGLRKYILKKVGRLDKYMSRHDQISAHAEVHLKNMNSKDHNKSSCEITLHLPHATLTAHETTLNMYAAVDIAETKLRHQLQKYKDLHESGKTHRQLFNRFRRHSA